MDKACTRKGSAVFSRFFDSLKDLPPIARIALFILVSLLISGLLFWSLSVVIFPPATNHTANHALPTAGMSATMPSAPTALPSPSPSMSTVTPDGAMTATPQGAMVTPQDATSTALAQGTVQPTVSDQPTQSPTSQLTPTALSAMVSSPTPAPTSTLTPTDAQSFYANVTAGAPTYSTSLANQDSGNWDTGSFSGGGGCAFTGGVYQLTVPQPGSAGVCAVNSTFISNFVFQVQMTIVSGDGGGIVFRDVNQQMDRFRIGADGTFELMNQTQRLATGTSPAIKAGLNQVNLLTVVAKGQQIYLF